MKDYDSLLCNKGLTIERLIALLRVANAHNLLDAAGGDKDRATSMSRMIRDLSVFFGTEMTERTNKTFRLSPNGKRLLPIAADFADRLLDFQRNLGQLPLQFSLGAGESILYSLVIPRLPELLDNEQNITLDLHRRWDSAIITAVSDHTLDFGIVAKENLGIKLAYESLGTTSYALYAKPQLLKKLRLTKDASQKELLEKLPFVSQHRGSYFQNLVVQRALNADIQLNFKLLCDSAPAALAAMKTGCFAGFVHSLAAAELGKEFVKIDLTMLKEVNPELVLIWKKSRIQRRTSQAEAFKNHLIRVLTFAPTKPPPRTPSR